MRGRVSNAGEIYRTMLLETYTKIGEQCFHASKGEKETAKIDPARSAVSHEPVAGIVRRESLEYGVVMHCQVVDAGNTVEQKPDDHHWSEDTGHTVDSEGLNEEEEDEDAACCTDDGTLRDVGHRNLKPLNGAQYFFRSQHVFSCVVEWWKERREPDWAGVRMPSAMMRLTPRTARIFKNACEILLFSSHRRNPRLGRFRSFVE